MQAFQALSSLKWKSRCRKLLAEALEQQRRLAAREEGTSGGAGAGASDSNGGAAAANGAAGAAAAARPAAEDGHGSEGLCVVCFARESNTVFPACGHMCVCVACAPALARCPICRARGACIRVYRT